METTLQRITQMSKENPDMVFTSIGHLINKKLLKECHDFLKFRTGFGQVLQYIKYSKNKEKLYQVTHEEKRFSELDEDSANLINTVTGSDLKFEVKEGRVNMCTAIDEMRKESRN